MFTASRHLVGSRQKLATGLYFVPGVDGDNSGALRGYILYWPEPTTWDDNATPTVKRNRITFMRYLTKVTHQVVCLISPEHSAALVWKDKTSSSAKSESASPRLARRVYSFGVQRTKEQRESVSTLPGSTVHISPSTMCLTLMSMCFRSKSKGMAFKLSRPKPPYHRVLLRERLVKH
jgi:hypothetical protein